MDRIVQKSKIALSQTTREFLAEMMGTFILVMFGIGSVAQHVLSDGKLGQYLSVNFGWGLGVTFGVYWSYGISGGHINPAVTLAMVVSGRMPFRKLPLYWLAQTVGAFVASALVFVVYRDLLDAHDKGARNLKNAAIWSTYPAKGVSHGTIFGDQVTGTAILVGTIFSLIDKKNSAPREALFPVAVGFLVVAIGASFGMNCGYGINPARDLVPRIFTAVAGWKSKPFTTNHYFFWIPILGQLCGAVLGAFIYVFTIELHHPDDEPEEMEECRTEGRVTREEDDYGDRVSSTSDVDINAKKMNEIIDAIDVSDINANTMIENIETVDDANDSSVGHDNGISIEKKEGAVQIHAVVTVGDGDIQKTKI